MEENKELIDFEEEFEVEGYKNDYCTTRAERHACRHDCIFDNSFYNTNA